MLKYRLTTTTVQMRRHMTKGISFSIALLFLALPGISQPLRASPVMNDSLIIRQINNYRATQGLQPLMESGQLKESSLLKVNDMLRLGYFSHMSPQNDPFQNNVKRVNYRYKKVGEILAKVHRKSEAHVLEVWLASEPHRRAILDPSYEDINCSNRLAPDRSYYVVCHLGRTSR